jgi:hypothetical protein
MATDNRKVRGPSPERLKLTGNWQKLIKKAVAKQRPKAGWPKPKPKPKAKAGD